MNTLKLWWAKQEHKSVVLNTALIAFALLFSLFKGTANFGILLAFIAMVWAVAHALLLLLRKAPGAGKRLVAAGVALAVMWVGTMSAPATATSADDEPAQIAETVEPEPEQTEESTPEPTETAEPEPEETAQETVEGDSAGDSSATATAVEGELATTVLATLAVKGRAPKTGYSRDRFGDAWSDVDGNGCDTRNDILKRDLTNITYKTGCLIATGTLKDPYTNTTIDFVRGVDTSSEVQIDHVVALSDAWQKGAQQLGAGERLALANDPYNLLAVSGSANQQKSDSDAASWLPSNKAFRCEYVARQIGVKAKYRLWVTSAESQMMGDILASCPAQTVPADDGVVDPANVTGTAGSSSSSSSSSGSSSGSSESSGSSGSSSSGTTSGSGSSSVDSTPADPSGSVYYKNCTAAREAGAAPIYRGDPGYRSQLDRDGDGVACE